INIWVMICQDLNASFCGKYMENHSLKIPCPMVDVPTNIITLMIIKCFTVSEILIILYINFLSNSSTLMVINVTLLLGDTLGSLQANRLFTKCSCSSFLSDCPLLIAKLFAIDFANKSVALKLLSGTSDRKSTRL